MGLFDMFRKKSPAQALQDEMRRVAPDLFPGGHAQIQSAGKSIAAMLDNRIPPEAAARLYASTKYLAHTASDKSKARVVQYILRQGMGKLSSDDASAIYDRFIAGAPAATQAAPQESTDGTMFINEALADRHYTLEGATQSIPINAALFTMLLLGLRSSGWRGATHLFESDTMMKPLSGSYLISATDAKAIASLLSALVASKGGERELEAAVRPLVAIASQGAFTTSHVSVPPCIFPRMVLEGI